MVPFPLGKGGFWNPSSVISFGNATSSSEEVFTSPEGWNKLPLTRELSPKVNDGYYSKNHIALKFAKSCD